MQIQDLGTETSKPEARTLRDVLNEPQLSFLMEAHNGISARIAAEAGFDALWASGLSMSAALGLRDRNEASWTQVLDLAEHIAESARIPVLLDGDTGFGDFNNVRRLVKKLETRGIQGVCLEDKLFPKVNSFIGDGQQLASIQEFTGKLKAAKDSQLSSEFVVVARIEALISGCGMNEALKRADAYRDAGADAILIHSKKKTADEILEFKQRWAGDFPVIIVPTTYFSTPTEAFIASAFAAVIWANHSLRASVDAMSKVTKTLMQEKCLLNVERNIAPVSEIFRLTDEGEATIAEAKYT